MCIISSSKLQAVVKFINWFVHIKPVLSNIVIFLWILYNSIADGSLLFNLMMQ